MHLSLLLYICKIAGLCCGVYIVFTILFIIIYYTILLLFLYIIIIIHSDSVLITKKGLSAFTFCVNLRNWVNYDVFVCLMVKVTHTFTLALKTDASVF